MSVQQVIPEIVRSHLYREKNEVDYFLNGNVLQEYIVKPNLFIADRLMRKMDAELHWFEKIIKHQPSVGLFYENLLKNSIKELIPGNLKVGTGFVYDSFRSRHSSQTDIIVYRDDKIAPLYRSDDFIIVDPKQVVSVCEVKKTLTTSNLRNVVKNNLLVNYGNYTHQPYDAVQYINIFAYSSSIKAKKICEIIIECVDKEIEKFARVDPDSGEKWQYPILNLTLPNVFIANQNGFVSTKLEYVRGTYIAKVDMFLTNHSNSLGEFMLQMIGEQYERIDLSQNNFVASPLRYGPKDFIPLKSKPFLVFDRINMVTLSRFYRSDFMFSPLYSNGQLVHSLYIPKGFDLHYYQDRLESLLQNSSILIDYGSNVPPSIKITD